MDISSFVDSLARIRLADVFNPYADVCPYVDTVNSPQIRRQNLMSYMAACEARGVAEIWLGRDLGYRGGRRTGLALTDEQHLSDLGRMFDAKPIAKATTGPIVKERTAACIWQVIRNVDACPFLWNVFPLHPHEPSEPLSNRAHRRSELELCGDVLSTLTRWLRPKRIVAIGNDARIAANQLGVDAMYVRHPSYGGQNEFFSGISRLWPKQAASRQGAFALT